MVRPHLSILFIQSHHFTLWILGEDGQERVSDEVWEVGIACLSMSHLITITVYPIYSKLQIFYIFKTLLYLVLWWLLLLLACLMVEDTFL